MGRQQQSVAVLGPVLFDHTVLVYVALIAVLIVDPFAPLAVGAWLSFVAVGVIAVILLMREQVLALVSLAMLGAAPAGG